MLHDAHFYGNRPQLIDLVPARQRWLIDYKTDKAARAVDNQ